MNELLFFACPVQSHPLLSGLFSKTLNIKPAKDHEVKFILNFCQQWGTLQPSPTLFKVGE
jgi:hypothetical protein